MKMKQCNHCLQWKEEEEFNWRYKDLAIRHPTCRECQKPFRRQWYEGSVEVSAMIVAEYSIENILAEVNKYVVLCSNCQRRLTVEEKGWFRSKWE